MVLQPSYWYGADRSGCAGVSMRMMVAVACALMLVGCSREEPGPAAPVSTPRVAGEPTTPPDSTPAASIEPLPARYSGVLPCADCAGIRYEVDLRPANVYFLRMTYLDATPERSYDDIGAWSVASDQSTLALRGSRQSPQLFSITNATTLRKLDLEGQPIESELNYTLKRDPAYEALAPQVPLRGMYSQTDAGAIVAECTTGLALKLEGDATHALAEEFAKLRKGANRPMLVAVEGKLTVRAEDPASGTLVATSTARFWPGETCGARGVTHEIEGSRWVLVRLGDQAVVVEDGRPEPYIVLQASTKEVAGHGGCNRLSGGYQIKDDTLELGELATTRMACPESETEHAFLTALESVAHWRLMDNQLVLLDKNNVAVLQLESRTL
jgi:copper homeostasis protein (lipoprotein)